VMGWAGKKAAGRLLDGMQHDGFPSAALGALSQQTLTDQGGERECCNAECGWTGQTDRMLGAVGPLCPDCGEVTEVASPPVGQERQGRG